MTDRFNCREGELFGKLDNLAAQEIGTIEGIVDQFSELMILDPRPEFTQQYGRNSVKISKDSRWNIEVKLPNSMKMLIFDSPETLEPVANSLIYSLHNRPVYSQYMETLQDALADITARVEQRRESYDRIIQSIGGQR